MTDQRTHETRGALRTAHALARAGRARDSLLLLAEIWQRDPDCIPAGAALAQAYLRSGDVGLALQVVAHLTQVDPTDFSVLELVREMGLGLYAQNRWEEARPYLVRAKDLEPWDVGLQTAAERSALPEYLAPLVEDPVAGHAVERYGPREGGRYIFVIDVAGTCNLRCPTCPVGNTELGDRGLGFMAFDMFDEIVAKIERESPCAHPQVNLFNWGEPLLHPDLPRMIRRLKEAGMRVCLSSNLNIKRGLREVIAANPDDLKISISGFSPRTYERSHKRGNLDLVRENMTKLRRYIDETGAGTRVWVGQHIYRSNQDEAKETEAFSRSLGFDYAPIQAYYMPLERVVDHLEGRDNPRDDGIISDLVSPPQPRSQSRDADGPKWDCELRFNQTVINYDGQVALCCSVYERDNMLGVSFLDTPFAEIERLKYRNEMCAVCWKHGQAYTPPSPFPAASFGALEP